MKLVDPRFVTQTGYWKSTRGACMLNPPRRQFNYKLIATVYERTGFDGLPGGFAFGIRLVLRRKHEAR